jgi:hypothetical protein
LVLSLRATEHLARHEDTDRAHAPRVHGVLEEGLGIRGNGRRLQDGKLVTDNVTFEIVGDALVDDRLKASVAELSPSLADAKVKLSAR